MVILRKPDNPRPRGPRPKLSAEKHEAIVDALRRGATLADAARLAGVHPVTLSRWLARGALNAGGPYRDLAAAVNETQRPKPIAARPRHIRRAYERQVAPSDIQILVYREMRRLLDDGRVSDHDALRAVEMLCADYDEKVENLSISWAEVMTAWRGR